MSTETRYKAPRIALKNPDDARRLIRRVLAQIFAQSAEVDSAGKVANLLTVWLKAYEIDKISDIEKRLEVVEREMKLKKSKGDEYQMKNLADIERRLTAAEKDMMQHEVALKLDYASRADATAYVLTGLPNDDPNVYELHWSNDGQEKGDAQKIRWLGPCTPEQLKEIQNEWKSSDGPRARAALRELNRLLAQAGGSDAIRNAFFRRGSG
jgi:hypothetical protein